MEKLSLTIVINMLRKINHILNRQEGPASRLDVSNAVDCVVDEYEKDLYDRFKLKFADKASIKMRDDLEVIVVNCYR